MWWTGGDGADEEAGRGLVAGEGDCHTNRELQDQARLTREAMNEMWNDGGQRHVSGACLYKNVSVKNYDSKAAPH